MRTRFQILGCMAVLLLFVLAPQSALAHAEHGMAGGFLSGLAHPILGLDHVVAMVAVGLWGAFLGMPAIWILPVVFPLVMAMGAVVGITGVPMPGVEIGIAASAVVLGLMIVFAVRPALWIAAVLVGLFAIFHGYAHGAELPVAANPFAYAIGFVIATGFLHLIGIAFGFLTQTVRGRIAVRAGGAVICLVGLAFLVQIA